MWLHSSVGRASHRYRGGHGFESRWRPDFFFQASSFQLLKLENLLRWSLFTLIYNRSTNMNYFIYISRVMFFLLYKSQWWRLFWWFSEDFRPLSEDFRRFSKIVPKARRTFPNILLECPKFPKMSEDFRRLPKTFEENPKMFRWYTNEFKYNLRDKLNSSEIIDILTCEDSISSHVRISYRFYQFVTIRYTTSLLRSRSGRSHVTLPVPTRLLQTDIHSFLGVSRFCLLGSMSLSFSCHCIRCTNHRREH